MLKICSSKLFWTVQQSKNRKPIGTLTQTMIFSLYSREHALCGVYRYLKSEIQQGIMRRLYRQTCEKGSEMYFIISYTYTFQIKENEVDRC